MNLKYLFSKLIKKSQLPALKSTKIHKTSKVCSGSHIVNSEVHRYTYIGNFCTIINVEIGSFCSIADNCIIGGASHPIEWVSTSPVFHEGKNILRTNFSSHEYKTSKKTVIDNDVWIGNNCLIKSGVKIENGAVIGMGSVLTKDVGKYEIWAGNPAKLIRKRFPDEKIQCLLDSEWWEWDDHTLYNNSSLFNNVEAFLKYHSQGEKES